MRKFRGIIALVLSVVFGLIAAKSAYWYLKKSKTETKPQKIITEQQPKKVTFSERIPDGMRIVTIKLSRDSDIPVQLEKGDIVDVAATSKIPEKNNASVTRIILEGIEIYDSGNEDGEALKKRSGNKDGHKVSLLVSPSDAVTIVAASESAKISLIARKKSDQKEMYPLSAAYSYDRGTEKIREIDFYSHELPVPGMRAITLTVKDTDGIMGMLKPGDQVDVIVTCPYSKFGSGGAVTPGSEGTMTEYSLSSEIVIQDVRIIATEKILDLSIGREEPAKRVALLVTPDQAVKLAVVADATKKSVIRLVSRHPEDHGSPEIRHELAEILADKKIYHRVEVFKGAKEDSKLFFR